MKSSIAWETATVSEQELCIAMTKLFATNDKLLTFVFDKDEPRLRAKPHQLVTEARSLSSGENVLVRLALDIWNDTGGVRITELLSRLDPTNFHNAIAALRYLGPKPLDPPNLLTEDPGWRKTLF